MILPIALLVLAILGLGLWLSLRSSNRHVRAFGVTTFGILLVSFTLVFGALWYAVVDAQRASSEGPFRLGGEHLVGGDAFDDVARCPLEFPELESLTRCRGEDRSFQEARWWVWAEGPPARVRVEGERRDCREFGFGQSAVCRLQILSDEPEHRRERLFLSPRAGESHPLAIVVEAAGYPMRHAVRRGIETEASAPGP